jgi:hypothetical protein
MKPFTKQGNRKPRKNRALVSAGNSVKSKTQSSDLPPHLHFLVRFKGSLPETIVEGDLATLNAGLAILFDQLRQAKRQHDEEADGGRAAARTTVGSMWQFVMLFNAPLAELLHMPALNLQTALLALEDNNVVPMLKPVARHGRAPADQRFLTLQGHASGTVRRLKELGHDLVSSRKEVARVLVKLGVRPQRGPNAITANTVRHWCDEVAVDVGRSGTAAVMYDSMFTDEENRKFQTLTPIDARRHALASLKGYVHTTFPELRAPARKPG